MQANGRTAYFQDSRITDDSLRGVISASAGHPFGRPRSVVLRGFGEIGGNHPPQLTSTPGSRDYGSARDELIGDGAIDTRSSNFDR
jgi:hypothetical protein